MNTINGNFKKNCLIGYIVCTRLKVFYKKFHFAYHFGNYQIIENFLTDYLRNIDSRTDLIALCESATHSLENMVPDMDDYNSELVPSLALDSISSILTLVDYTLSSDPQSINDLFVISMNSAEFINENLQEFNESFHNYDKDSLEEEEKFLIAIELLKNKTNNLEQTASEILEKHQYPE